MTDITVFVPIPKAHIETVLENPSNYAPRAVLADWLEEQGDPRAPWLRWWIGRLKAAVEKAILRAKPKEKLVWPETKNRQLLIVGSLVWDLCWRTIIVDGATLSSRSDPRSDTASLIACLRWLNLVDEQQADAARQQADAAWQQAYAVWQQAYAAWQQAYATWQQANAARQQANAAWQQAYAAWQQHNGKMSSALRAAKASYKAHQFDLPRLDGDQ